MLGVAHTALRASWAKYYEFALSTHKSQKDVMCGQHPDFSRIEITPCFSMVLDRI